MIVLFDVLLNVSVSQHGASSFITDLLCHQYGNQLHKMPVPQMAIGKRFIDVLCDIKCHYQSIVVGIQQDQTGQVISNPAADYVVQANDFLITIRPI